MRYRWERIVLNRDQGPAGGGQSVTVVRNCQGNRIGGNGLIAVETARINAQRNIVRTQAETRARIVYVSRNNRRIPIVIQLDRYIMAVRNWWERVVLNSYQRAASGSQSVTIVRNCQRNRITGNGLVAGETARIDAKRYIIGTAAEIRARIVNIASTDRYSTRVIQLYRDIMAVCYRGERIVLNRDQRAAGGSQPVTVVCNRQRYRISRNGLVAGETARINAKC